MKRYLVAIFLLVGVAAFAGSFGSTMPGAGGGGSSFDPSTNTSPVQAPSFTSTAADNTRGWEGNNTGPVSAGTLRAGWMSTQGNGVYLRNTDNTASAVVAEMYRYHRLLIDAPTVADNAIFAGPLDYAQTWDNVTALVMDNTGKLSTASADNVTFNLQYCTSTAATSCTNVFTSDQTATGAAVLAPALNNTTPSAGEYLRVVISAANMTYKKLLIRARYYKR